MERWQQDLDRYITDGHYSKHEEDITCKLCGHTWEVTVCEEYGMGWYEPDETPVCSQCGTEYDEQAWVYSHPLPLQT